MLESTAKEKEFAKSIYNMLIILSIAIVLLNTTWLYKEEILAQLKHPLNRLFLQIIKGMTALNRSSILMNRSFLQAFLLIVLVLFGTVNTGKINLKATMSSANTSIAIGSILLLIAFFLNFNEKGIFGCFLFLLLNLTGIIFFMSGSSKANSIINVPTVDLFNKESEEFPQNEILIENEFSVKYKYTYHYKGKYNIATCNVVYPQRAVLILGVQGSGKTFSIMLPALWQSIMKGYAALVYDYKYPDMAKHAYNAFIKALQNNKFCFGKKADGSPIIPQFKILDCENLLFSNRCNPLQKKYVNSIDEAAEVAKALLLNINKSWKLKEGDFFPESAINIFTCCIWFTRMREDEYKEHFTELCTLPHVIELINKPIRELISILSAYNELDAYTTQFKEAIQDGALEQLQGQIASLRNALSKLSSRNIYWIMTGNDVDLDINNKENPKILVLGNLPRKKQTYSVVMSLYMSTIMRMMYERNGVKTALFLDEFPTMYFKGFDDFITTVRSYNVASWIGIQDYEQLTRDFGKDADVIINNIGTIFTGKVNNATAEKIAKGFGKSNQQKINTNFSKGDISISYSTQLQEALQPTRLSQMPTGNFAGLIADSFVDKIEKPLFNGEFYVPVKEMELKHEIPQKYEISQEEMDKLVNDNFFRIKDEMKQFVIWELDKLV